MKGLVLYLHVHQPYRISPYNIFSVGYDHDYFDDRRSPLHSRNEQILKKVAEKSYIPTNRMLKELLDRYPDFKVSLSITGTFIDQCEAWAPEVLRSFQELTATGRVEIVAETYHHSLAFFYSRFEFEKQVAMHRDKIRSIFGVSPRVFRNTELSYNNEIGQWADEAGYKAVLAEGWDPVLGFRSSNYVYQADNSSAKLLLKNYRLSDDIAFRFSNRGWAEWPLTADKYMSWLPSGDEQLVNLFMDYETFGEHQWEDTGVFDFMRDVVRRIDERDDYTFMTVSEAADLEPRDTVSMPYTVTWADSERDLSAWLGNPMQQEALQSLYDLENDILTTHNPDIVAKWRLLQTSDHVYYMCTKWFNDGDVHAYFSPYSSPYDAFLYFMNAVRDLRWQIIEHNRQEGR